MGRLAQSAMLVVTVGKGLLVIPVKLISSISQPYGLGVGLALSEAIRKRTFTVWLARVLPMLIVAVVSAGHPALVPMKPCRPLSALVAWGCIPKSPITPP